MADGVGHLSNQVSRLEHAVNTVDAKMTEVGRQVTKVGLSQAETRTELQQLREEFVRFVRQAEFTANIQRAETKLGSLQDQLEHEFGHHKVVRRSATGILQAFDSGLISEETIRGVSEQLMISSPRYWLAPALVALSAWAGDDQVLCQKAVTEAFRRSPDRTSMLFSLVLRRQGRYESAARWLRHYLAAQNPAELGRDFAVILESISQGAFGAAGLELAEDTLTGWRETLLADDAVQATQVRLWRGEVDSYIRPTSTRPDFPHLAEVASEWSQLDTALRRAEAHDALLRQYTAMMAEEAVPSHRIEDAVDDILDRLVSEYDTEELPLKREIDKTKAILAADGDLAAAQAIAQNSKAFETTLDYLTIQSTSALRPADIGVSRATQRLSVAACKDWFAQAHEEFSANCRAGLPYTVTAVFDSTHNVGAKTFSLPRWKGAFTEPMPALEASLGDHWDTHGRIYVASLAFDWRQNALVPALVVGGGFLLSLILHFWEFAFFVLLVGGGIWAGVLYSRAQASLRAQEQARQAIATFKQQSLVQLREAGAELTDWQSRYQDAERVEPQARQLILDLSSASHVSTPFAARTVLGTRGL